MAGPGFAPAGTTPATIQTAVSFWITPSVRAAVAGARRLSQPTTVRGVTAFWRAGLQAGGRDNGAPGIRAHYHPTYFGAFVLDPDGHNIEAVCHAPV